MLSRRPNDDQEDFWLFSVVTDDTHLPTWDSRISVTGTYEQCATTSCAAVDVLLVQGVTGNKIHIESYRGDSARRFMAESVSQETKYHAELRNQPNN